MKTHPGFILAVLVQLVVSLSPSFAHPGSGIVVDSKGRVYFNEAGDPAERLPGSIWQIDAQGKLTRLKVGGAHYLAWTRSGVLHSPTFPPGSESESLPGCSSRTRGRDADSSRWPAAGVASRRQFVLRDAKRGGGPPDARRKAGDDCADAGSSRRKTRWHQGTAATGCRAVVKISPDGKSSVVMRAEAPWSPTGVAVRGDAVYVLEYEHPHSQSKVDWRPRVRKLARDGKVTTLVTLPTAQSRPVRPQPN